VKDFDEEAKLTDADIPIAQISRGYRLLFVSSVYIEEVNNSIRAKKKKNYSFVALKKF
jgi:hypothetical protein